jgi:CheY-like chemotaxis protein
MGELNPDIVVMDVQMGDMSGVESTRRILSRHPHANVVLTSMGSDSEYPTLAQEDLYQRETSTFRCSEFLGTYSLPIAGQHIRQVIRK